MFNFVNGGLPSSLLGIYQYHRDTHEQNTRHSTDPRTPSANSDILRKSFLYQGPKLWASLDGHLKDSRTKSLFKRRMKTNCIDNYWYELAYKMSNTWDENSWPPQMVWINELVSTKQEMHDNGWNISLQQPGNSFGDHSLIMRLHMLVYVVTWDVRNSMCI